MKKLHDYLEQQSQEQLLKLRQDNVLSKEEASHVHQTTGDTDHKLHV